MTEIVDASSNDASSNNLSEWTDEHKKVIHMVCKKTGLSPKQAYDGLMRYKGDYKKVIAIADMYNTVQIVMRQTNYEEKDAFEKLSESDWDPVKVIRDYMHITSQDKDDNEDTKTVNQGIFKEIRDFMDTAMQGYNERKEHAERLQTLQALYKKMPKN